MFSYKDLSSLLCFFRSYSVYLQIPHFPPSLAQCLQYLQFLQALQDLLPVHVASFSILKYENAKADAPNKNKITTIIFNFLIL